MRSDEFTAGKKDEDEDVQCSYPASPPSQLVRMSGINAKPQELPQGPFLFESFLSATGLEHRLCRRRISHVVVSACFISHYVCIDAVSQARLDMSPDHNLHKSQFRNKMPNV